MSILSDVNVKRFVPTIGSENMSNVLIGTLLLPLNRKNFLEATIEERAIRVIEKATVPISGEATPKPKVRRLAATMTLTTFEHSLNDASFSKLLRPCMSASNKALIELKERCVVTRAKHKVGYGRGGEEQNSCR